MMETPEVSRSSTPCVTPRSGEEGSLGPTPTFSLGPFTAETPETELRTVSEAAGVLLMLNTPVGLTTTGLTTEGLTTTGPTT